MAPNPGHPAPRLAQLTVIASAALCVLLAAPCALAATFYVSTTGSDAAAGTLDAPWKSIRASVARLQDGDTLLVQSGTYFEGDINPGIHAVPITIQAVASRQAIIDGGGRNWFGIGVNDRVPARYQGCRLVGLRIQNHKIGIGCQTIADDFVIEDCEITGCSNSGIRCVGGRNWTVRNSFVHGNRNGIWFGVKGGAGVKGVLIEDCVSSDNINPKDANTDGILVEDQCPNTIIRRCTCSGNGDQGFDVKPAGALVERCLAYGNMGGFKLWGDGIRLINCMVRNNKGTGLKLMGNRTELWNCTIAYNETGLRPQAPDNSTVLLRNCVIAFNINKQYTPTMVDDDHNLYWVSPGQPVWRMFLDDETLDYTLDDLKARRLALGPHTLLAAPQFVDPAAGDLAPGPGSPAVSAGLWAAFLTEDLLGDPRETGAPADLGALNAVAGDGTPASAP